MASSNVSIGTLGGEFEADATAHVATLAAPGRWAVRNVHATQALQIVVNGSAAGKSQPAGVAGMTIKPGAVAYLPFNCSSFGFVAAAQSFFQVERGLS